MAVRREKVGQWSEEMTTTMDYQVETTATVVGTSSVSVSVGSPTTDVTPVRVTSESEFSKRLARIIILLEYTDDVKAMFTNVYANVSVGGSDGFDETKLLAWRESAYIIPTNNATGNAELSNDCTLNWTKIREYGTTDMTNSSPTFVPIAKPKPSDLQFREGMGKREDYAIFYEYEEEL